MRRALLDQADLPQGWTPFDPAVSVKPSDLSFDEQMVSCGIGPSPAPFTAYVAGPELNTGDATNRRYAQSMIRVVPSLADAAADLERFKSGRLADCRQHEYDAVRSGPTDGRAVPGSKTGNVVPTTIEQRAIPSPDGGNDVVGFRLTMPFPDAPTVVQDVYFFTYGRSEIVFWVAQSSAPDVALESRIVSKLRAKVRAAYKT